MAKLTLRQWRQHQNGHRSFGFEGGLTLEPRQWEALEELSQHRGYDIGPYWWRQASMGKLREHGLVEAYKPEGSTLKRLAHRITEAGRTALQESSK